MQFDSHAKNKPCSVARTLRVIGSKWTAILLHNLFDGKKRFGELQAATTGISPKTLSIRLHELEKEGIITKHVYAEVPPRVEYELTNKGKSLEHVFITMARWGDAH